MNAQTKTMNIFDILGHSIFDKWTLAATFSGLAALKISSLSVDLLTMAPAAIVLAAAIWKHYQKGIKEREEAKTAINKNKLVEKQLNIAQKDYEEAVLENQILIEKLEQEKLKTEKLKQT